MQERRVKLEKKTIDDYLDDLDFSNVKSFAQDVYDTVYMYMMDRDNIRNTERVDFMPMDDFSKYFLPDFKEFLYETQKTVADMVIENEKNINLGTDKSSRFLKEFLNDPIEAMKRQSDLKEPLLDKLAKNQKSGNLKSERNYAKMAEFNRKLRSELLAEKESYNEYVKNKKNIWKDRQNKKAEWFNCYFDTNLINRSIDKNKGGFFENLFNTTSAEYKEFSRRLVNIKEEGPEKGDLAGLKDAALKYMKYKLKGSFSNFDSNYMFDEAAFNKLDKTSQGRIRLCQCVLDAINEAEKNVDSGIAPTKENQKMLKIKFNEEYMIETKLIGQKALKENDINQENNIIDNEIFKDVKSSEKNINFQNDIKKDIDDEFINNEIDSNEINTNVINKDLNK